LQVYGKRGGKKVYVGTYDSRREALKVDEDYRVSRRAARCPRRQLP
jgi:hypothetical protein